MLTASESVPGPVAVPLPAPRSRAPIVMAGAVTGLLLLLAGEYGFHRDELYFIVAGRHPAFGYVDQPPLTPLLAALSSALMGLTPLAVRVPSALAAGAVILLTAEMARRLGGGRASQILAAATVSVTGLLAAGHLASTTTFDLLAWAVVLWLAIRLLDGEDQRLWLALGVAGGLGLQNKMLIAFLGAGLVLGAVLSRRWDVLRARWAWAGACVAVAIWLPNLAWQAGNGWPQLEMARILAERAAAERDSFVAELFLLSGSFSIFIPVAGLAWLLRAADPRRWRMLGWSAVAVIGLVLATGGKSYYLAGVVPLLIAAGSVPIARWLGGRYRQARAALVGVPIIVSGITVGLIALPVIPAASLADTPIPELYGEAGEQIGWPELVAEVESAAASLTPEERQSAAILTVNYGEAGALELLGHDLPPIVSGHNAWWEWGPPPPSTRIIILVGWRAGLPAGIEDCTTAGRVDNGLGIENEEQGAPIRVCRSVPSDWDAAWPSFRHLS